jgi:hypothetical protein
MRVFVPYCVTAAALIPCGNKRKLLEAHALLQAGEELRIVCVLDCDYDVATERLAPRRNLIITDGVDVESDLLRLGVIERLVTELVPRATRSDDERAAISKAVGERAGSLAEAIGRFRLLSAREGWDLRFDGIRHHRYRTTNVASADTAKLAVTLCNTSGICPMSPTELDGVAAEMETGPELCHGKDLLDAIATVLHQDYGVEKQRLTALDALCRVAVSKEAFERWMVVRRLVRWQHASGRRVLAAS